MKKKHKKHLPSDPEKREKTVEPKPQLSGKPDRGDWIRVILLLVTFAIAYSYIFDPKLDIGGDNAGYYIYGKAIADGNGYTNVHKINPTPANWFPPGYPYLLGGVLAVFGKDIEVAKFFNGVFFILSITFLYFILQRFRVNRDIGFTAGILLILNAVILRFSTIVMSEIPFLLFSILTVFFLIRMDAEKPFYKDHNFFLMIIFLAITYHIRSAGLSLLFGVAFYFLFTRRWLHVAGTVAGFILLAIPNYLREKDLGGEGYVGQLLMINPYRPELGSAGVGDMVARFFANLTRYLSEEIPNALFPLNEPSYAETTGSEWVFGLLVVGLMIFGIFRLPKYRFLIIGYVLGTFGILLLWPDVWQGPRFMLPLIPFMMFLLIFGTVEAVKYLSGMLKLDFSLNPLFFLILAFFLIAPLKDLHVQAEQQYPPGWQAYINAAKWAKNNTPEGSLFSCRKPFMFYVYSERPVTRFARTTDEIKMIKDLGEREVDYVVLDGLGYADTYRYLLPAIQKFPDIFAPVYQIENPATYLLKFKKQQAKEVIK